MHESDRNISVQKLKNLVRVFCEKRDWDQYHSPKDLAIGVVTEAAELLDLFRFKSEVQSKALLKDKKKRRQVAEELADVLYFLLRFAQMYEFDLYQELTRKVRVNGRKYPVNRVKGHNLKYTEYSKGDRQGRK